ncbi:MAG: pirin family protein [Bacteroidetes bacterium]|nr:pirin family protein [Bacteroidota bacterium]
MQNPVLSIEPLGFPWKTLDPFLFCVFHHDDYPKGNGNLEPAASLAGRNIGNDFTIKDGWRMYHGSRIPGFPYHPHRGFETITIANQGVVDHSDSLGAAGRFSVGDVQWMTAGKGVLHSEMFPMLNDDSENTLEIFQIWLNLPKASKFVEPHFKMLWNNAIPEIQENGVHIRIIGGQINNIKAPSPTPDSWAANPDHEVAVWTIDMEAGADWTIPVASAEANRMLYFYEGESLLVGESKIPFNHCVRLQADIPAIIKNGKTPSRLLFLQGKPINEPVVQYGPFVMNTEMEIQQAFADYRRTQFGGWPWPKEEMAHDKNRKRFALHADGTLEEPN